MASEKHFDTSLLLSGLTGEDILQVWLRDHPEVKQRYHKSLQPPKIEQEFKTGENKEIQECN